MGGYIGVTLGLPWVTLGLRRGYIRVTLGLHRYFTKHQSDKIYKEEGDKNKQLYEVLRDYIDLKNIVVIYRNKAHPICL